MTDNEVPQGNQDDALSNAEEQEIWKQELGISQDTEGVKALSSKADNLCDITATFKLMAEYVDSCNDQSDETGGLAVVPNFKGFKKFLDAKLEVTT